MIVERDELGKITKADLTEAGKSYLAWEARFLNDAAFVFAHAADNYTTQEALDAIEAEGDDFSFNLNVVTEEEAEKADCVVCTWIPRELREGHVLQALETKCHDCKTDIIYSPTVPTKPIKLCMACAADRMRGGLS